MSSAPDSLIKVVKQSIDLLGRAAAKAPVRLAYFALLTLVTTWPLLSSAGSLNTYRDSHPLVQYEESARQTLLQFGEAPLWDPYYCGGLDGLGTPQSRFVSPTFLITLIFGTLRAEPLIAFVMILIGLEGAFRYARSRGSTNLGAALGSPVFALSGIFAVAPALGWYNFFGFELVPWAVLGVRWAMRGRGVGVVLAAVALAWIVGFGGTYSAPMAALWCAFEVVEFAIAKRKNLGRLKIALPMAVLTGVLALELAAIRLWPVVETLRMAPRIIGGSPGTMPEIILRMLLGRIHPDNAGDFRPAGTFLVGGFAAIAVGAGLARKKSIPLILAASFWMWLAAGYAANVSAFAALKELPLYSTLRYPERFLILFALAVSAIAALGISRLQVYARNRKMGGVALAVAVAAMLANLGPLVVNHWAATNGRPMGPPPPTLSQDFHQARGTRWALAYYGPMSRGCLSCYDAYPVPQSPLLRGDLKAEEYLEDATAGTVTRTKWTPNHIELTVHLERPARLRINQNWHPGWRTSVGTIASEKGLLAVELPAGDHALTLRFLPRAAVGGALATLAALAVLGWLLAFTRRTGHMPGASKMALLSMVPIVPVVLAFALMHEPPLPKTDLRTPNGEDIVVDAPPKDARILHTKFAAGMTLEAARLSSAKPAAESALTIELDWKADAQVEPGMGVFVHLVPTSGEDLRADHVMLSDVLEIEKAPPGKILRDIGEITIPFDAGGKQWTVWAGLWRVRKNGKRVSIEDNGSAAVADDRVQIGTFYVP